MQDFMASYRKIMYGYRLVLEFIESRLEMLTLIKGFVLKESLMNV